MSRATCRTRQSLLKNFLLSDSGNESPEDMSAPMIESIYDYQVDLGLAQNTIYGTSVALRSYFKLAIEYGEASENPVDGARTIRQERNATFVSR